MQFSEKLEYVRNHRGIRLTTTEAKNNLLVSEPNYHTMEIFEILY